jgi:hypothetical protein
VRQSFSPGMPPVKRGKTQEPASSRFEMLAGTAKRENRVSGQLYAAALRDLQRSLGSVFHVLRRLILDFSTRLEMTADFLLPRRRAGKAWRRDLTPCTRRTPVSAEKQRRT